MQKKKYSKSAPGHLAKDKVPKHKSQAGQAADAAAAEALSASTPPASTADGAVESASRKKKKGDKSLKGTVELDAEKVNALASHQKLTYSLIATFGPPKPLLGSSVKAMITCVNKPSWDRS